MSAWYVSSLLALTLLTAGRVAVAQSVSKPSHDPLAPFGAGMLCASRRDTVRSALGHIIEVMHSSDSTAASPVHYERQAAFSYDSLGTVQEMQLIASEHVGNLARTALLRASFDSSGGQGSRADGVLRMQPATDSTGGAVMTSRIEALEERSLSERELAETRRLADALWRGPCRSALVAR